MAALSATPELPAAQAAAAAGKGSGRRHRSRGNKRARPRWTGPEQRAGLLRMVPQCVRDRDRREVMSLLRQTDTQRRESGLVKLPACTAPASQRAELTLLQGACLEGGSLELVTTLLLHGASPSLATPVIPADRSVGGRATGGHTPLHLALIGSGRERNKIVRELLVYGADVNAKDADGCSFFDLTSDTDLPFTSLHQLITQAGKDLRAKKAQEASRSLVEAQRKDMQREELRSVIAQAELVDPMESLPVELCLHFLSFLSMAQLARSCLVSSLWRYIATDHTLWRTLYIAELGPVPPSAEHNLHELLQRGLALRAEREAKQQLQQMQQAKLVVQIVQHANCDHRSHHMQVEWPSGNAYLRSYSRCRTLVCTFDTREHTLRFGDYYNNLDHHLDPAVLKVTHTAHECKVRCSSVSGRRKTYVLKVGDKLSVLEHRPQSSLCRVYFLSLTLDWEHDTSRAPSILHYFNHKEY